MGTYLGEGSVDFIKGKGTGHGKAICTFEDGSSHTLRFTMDLEPAGKGLVRWKGRGEFVGGTGRFDGMKGTATFSGRTYTPNNEVTKGDALVVVVGKYSVAKKTTAQK